MFVYKIFSLLSIKLFVELIFSFNSLPVISFTIFSNNVLINGAEDIAEKPKSIILVTSWNIGISTPFKRLACISLNIASIFPLAILFIVLATLVSVLLNLFNKFCSFSAFVVFTKLS